MEWKEKDWKGKKMKGMERNGKKRSGMEWKGKARKIMEGKGLQTKRKERKRKEGKKQIKSILYSQTKKNYYLCVECSLGKYILEQKPLPELARNKWLYSRPFLASVLCY